MARPKLGESETVRLQLIITEDEVRAIDDWRYAHRVPSRSEAIRRLCAMALKFDRHCEAERAIEEAMRDPAFMAGMGVVP